nr:MAG: Tail Collar Domain [Bacteriophage sp.]
MGNFDKLFGRTYSTVGNSDSDFIIKTRGQVKVQWGKKFIDIIKDGKLNVDVTLIKEVSSIDSITSDGIYMLEGSNTVVVRINGVTVSLVSDNSDNYVSFIRPQLTTDEQKKQAQRNIGLRYSTIQEAITDSAYNGILFIDSDKKLYIAEDGVYTEYLSDISNPYNKQILIKKTIKREGEGIGALVVSGNGEDNSLVIGSQLQGLQVYNEDSNAVVKGVGTMIEIYSDDSHLIELASTGVTFKTRTAIEDTLVGDMIQSTNSSSISGYRLYYDEYSEESTLEVDNLITRNSVSYVDITYSDLYDLCQSGKLKVSQLYRISDFQNEWALTSEDDIVLNDKYQMEDNGEIIYDDNGQPIVETPKNVIPIVVFANTSSSVIGRYLADDIRLLIDYDISFNQNINGLTAKGRITKLTDEKGNSCNYDFKHLRFKITEDGVDKWIYTFRNGEEDLSLTDTCKNNVLTVNNYEIKSETVTVRDNGNIVTLQGTLSDNNFGTINSNFNFSGTANKLNVSGTLENVTFKEDSTIDEVAIRSLTNVTFNESFSRTTFHSDINDVDFDTTVYALLYDNEKVKDVYYNNNTVSVICIPDMSTATSGIPAGTIVMYNGTSGIPAGWAICDGTEGTPNLTGNFIKASETAGETGEFIPASSGSSTETPITYYSLVFIMKLA